MSKLKTFAIEYRHKGRRFDAMIEAEGFADAEARLTAIRSGEVLERQDEGHWIDWDRWTVLAAALLGVAVGILISLGV